MTGNGDLRPILFITVKAGPRTNHPAHRQISFHGFLCAYCATCLAVLVLRHAVPKSYRHATTVAPYLPLGAALKMRTLDTPNAKNSLNTDNLQVVGRQVREIQAPIGSRARRG